MPTTFQVRGDQVLLDPRFNPLDDSILWSGSIPFPDDYQISFTVSSEGNIIPSDAVLTQIDVYDAAGEIVGTYLPRKLLSSSRIGEDHIEFNGYVFEADNPLLPSLWQILILNGSNSAHDLDDDGIQLTDGDGQYRVLELPVPCFGPDTLIFTGIKHCVRIDKLKVGDHVITRTNYDSRIAWIGSQTVKITEKNRPYRFGANVFSPQHRILIDCQWHKAKHVGFPIDPMPKTMEYWHVLLENHQPIMIADRNLACFAESLLPTERALASFPNRMVKEIKKAAGDLSLYPGLRYPEAKSPNQRKKDALKRQSDHDGSSGTRRNQYEMG